MCEMQCSKYYKCTLLQRTKVRDIVDFARMKVNIISYLPDYDYVKDPNREWIWNMLIL